MCGADLVKLCDVWGRDGGIVQTVCGAELVELCRRCMGQSWWNCADGVWGRVDAIVQTVCAICFELRTILYLSGTAVHFCTYTWHGVACL